MKRSHHVLSATENAKDARGWGCECEVFFELAFDHGFLRTVVSAGNVLDCKKGSQALLRPVAVKLEALNLLKVQLFVFDKNGKLLKVKAVVKIDLGLLGKLVNGIVDLVLDVVDEIVVGVEGKVIKLFCSDVLLAKLIVSL